MAIDQALLALNIAVKAETVLTREAIYPNTANTNFDPSGYFNQGEKITGRIPLKRAAQNIDVRGAGVIFDEGAYTSFEVVLDMAFANGFIKYGTDPGESLAKYTIETGEQAGIAVATANDDYMYSAFRTWSATTGVVNLTKNSPIAIVANCDPLGNFTSLDSQLISNASVALDLNDVPDRDRQRYLIMGSVAKGNFNLDGTRITGFAAGLTGSGQYLINGIPQNQFFPAYGFNAAGSNVIKGQNGVTSVSVGAGLLPEATISVITPNTDFKDGQSVSNPNVGAVEFTLALGAGNTLSPNVAVGQIAQIRSTGNAPKAHFVILRIVNAATANPILIGVPHSLNGRKVESSAFVTTDKIRVPFIPAVGTAHHRAGLVMATRRVQQPTAGSGAYSAISVNPENGLAIQVFFGSYDVGKFSEKQTYVMLTGSQFVNFKMGVLILSQ